MVKFGKYTSLIRLLLFVAVFEFIGLVGVLILDGQSSAQAAVWRQEPVEETPPSEETMPEWLEPVPEKIVEKQKPEGELTGPEILAQTNIVSHGFGAVDEKTVLNCREGFEAMYAQGVRAFEVDLRMTSDQKVVLRHDWRAGWQEGIRETSIPTLEEFLNTPILDKYTPMSFQDLLLLMEEYPDICIITDTKFTEAEIVRMQFEAMAQDAAELGLSYLLDRFVVQIYNPLMFSVADGVHHFQGYIYTFYQGGFAGTPDAFREEAVYCSTENHMIGITMGEQQWDPAYAGIAQEYGLAVYTHTVNDLEQARTLLESGVSGVYTDFLTPASLDPDAAAEEEDSGGDTPDNSGGSNTGEITEEGDI